MLGFAIRSEPVFMKTVATSCAGMSVYIERITAMSSTCLPNAEKTSLTSMPDWPCLVNLNGDDIATPLRSGKGLSSYLARAGFGPRYPLAMARLGQRCG